MCPIWLVTYRFININSDTSSIANLSAIQYVRSLDSILRGVVLIDLSLVPVYLLKAYVRDGFYRINLWPAGTPKLGLVFPSEVEV